MIFAQSYGYQDFTLKVAKDNPSVTFEHPGGYKLASNFGTFWAPCTPMHYALGVIAGHLTKTGTIGSGGSGMVKRRGMKKA